MGVEPKALGDFFDRALVSPVLTADPTEVRRKSTLTRELEIADLLDERERAAGDEAELARNEEQLRRAVLILWRTNMLRQTTDHDRQVANGPPITTTRSAKCRGFTRRSRTRSRSWTRAAQQPIPSLRMALDRRRSGRQPYVTAGVLNEATRLRSARASTTISRNCTSLAASFARRRPRSGRDELTRSPTGRATLPPIGATSLASHHHRHVFAPRQDRARPRHVGRCAIR